MFFCDFGSIRPQFPERRPRRFVSATLKDAVDSPAKEVENFLVMPSKRNTICAVGALGLAFSCASAPAPQEPRPGPVEAKPVDFNEHEAWAKERGLEVRRFDLNRDNEPDVFAYVRVASKDGEDDRVVRKDIDLNHDGRIDIVQMYRDNGEVESEQSDLDFDGKPDIIAYYENSELARKELDFDYDGKPDMTRYYVEGKIDHIESDNNGDKRVDTWEYFVDGEIDRIGTDNDGDGIVDHWDRKREAPNTVDAPEGGESDQSQPNEPGSAS